MTVLDELVVTLEADTAPLKRGLDDAVRATETAGQNLQRSARGLNTIEKALDGISINTRTASQSFSDFADDLLRDLERIALKTVVIDPVKDILSGALGGLIGSVFPATPQPRADGGPVTAGDTFLVGERGPELLRMGSQSGFIEPNTRLGGGTVNVNVINNTGADIQTREQPTANGGREIEILIDEAVARNIRRPGSRANTAIRDTFGANPVTVGR